MIPGPGPRFSLSTRSSSGKSSGIEAEAHRDPVYPDESLHQTESARVEPATCQTTRHYFH